MEDQTIIASHYYHKTAKKKVDRQSMPRAKFKPEIRLFESWAFGIGYLLTYLLTYLLHGAGHYLKS
jgi:hypothetical protein